VSRPQWRELTVVSQRRNARATAGGGDQQRRGWQCGARCRRCLGSGRHAQWRAYIRQGLDENSIRTGNSARVYAWCTASVACGSMRATGVAVQALIVASGRAQKAAQPVVRWRYEPASVLGEACSVRQARRMRRRNAARRCAESLNNE